MKFNLDLPEDESARIWRIAEVNSEQQGYYSHAHHRGWIISWQKSRRSPRYDLYLDDDKGVTSFIYEDCLDLQKAIELASRAINAVVDGDASTRAKFFDPLSRFNNSLSRQIWRSDEGLDPIIDRARYGY